MSYEPIHVQHVVDVALGATLAPTHLVGIRMITAAEIHGHVSMRLDPRANVAHTTFVPTVGEDGEEQRPLLRAGDGSFLLNVEGSVDIGKAPGIHIAAGERGLAVHLDSSTSPDDKPWKGTMMTDVILPAGLVGRRVLDVLEGAYQFTPSVKKIPGRDQTLLARVLGRRQTRYTGDREVRRQLYEDAEFVRELSVLCRKKGTPGSVATTVGWCAYRLRHLKARGVERLALSVYRMLGYGERPLPALITWLCLSLALAGPVLAADGAKFDWTGVDLILSEAGRLALGPLAGLLRGGNLSGGDLAEIAARALTSIPLVTGALALRNYVKAER